MLNFMSDNKRILNLHEKIFSDLENLHANTIVFQANTNASLKNLEMKIGQLAQVMKKEPKDCMAVTLRSGRELDERRVESKNIEEEKQAEIGEEHEQNSSEATEKEKSTELHPKQQGRKEGVKAYNPPVPFPQRLQKAKLEEQFSKFLNMFKKIEINIPFSEALTQMPHYAKFMKDLLNKKRKFTEEGIVSLNAASSTVIQKSIPEKRQDPSSFTIPCMIGNADMGKALCDSEANINLMPLFVAKRLSLGELTPTAMTLQMVDRTLAHPEGILEDVLIKVGKFVFPVDFVVINIKEDKQVLLLLGRPFVATGAALIDVKKGELTLRVGDEAVHFNLNDSLKQLELRSADCEFVETKIPFSSELATDCNFQNSMNENEMSFLYLKHLEVEFLNSNFKLKDSVFSIRENSAERSSSYEEEVVEENKSSEGLILKELPEHLKYAFLQPEKGKPIIILAGLTKLEEQKLFETLKK